MAFGIGTVVTNLGKQIFAQRVQQTPPSAGSTTPPAAGGHGPQFVAIGVGATAAARTAAITDTSLSTEVETRTTGTESITTTSVTNDTYQVVGLITATAARAVDEAALWDIGTQSTTTTAQANAAATTVLLAASVFNTGGGTCYAVDRTHNGAQTIAYSAVTGTTSPFSMACTALTGQINNGDRVVSGNLFASATFNVINLSNGDTLQLTWKVQLT